MNYSAKLRLYFHICKRFRGKVLDFWGLIGKNLRRWGGASCPTDYTDTHGFHRCTQIFLRSPDVSSHADFADFADLADFLPFYPFKFPHGFHGFRRFFAFLPFYLFTFKSCIKC